MAKELDAFLAANSEPSPPAEPTAPVESTPPPVPAQEPPPAEPAKEPPPAKEADAEDAEPEAQHDGAVPRAVFDAERHRRNDWKQKAVRYETEASELRKQLDEAKQRASAPPPPPAPPPQPVPMPDFQTDPHGFMAHVINQNQQVLLNERLNMSEAMLRDKLGDQEVDAYIAEFQEMAKADPALFAKAHAQRNPYGWVAREVDRHRMMRDVGDDPAAYRERVIAEERAKWEAEMLSRQPSAPSQPPAPNLPPSLATVRSAAPRSAAAWSGEPSLEDVVHSIQTRKQRNGH